MSEIYKGYRCENDEDKIWVDEQTSKLALEEAQARYYNSLADINEIFLRVLEEMNDNEIKQLLIRIPIKRIDN